MKASLNGQPCDVPPVCGSFGDLVFFVEQQRLPAGEVLTRIALDGETLDADRERALEGRPCAELGHVEFHSSRPAAFVSDGLGAAGEILGELANDLPLIAKVMREGSVAEGLDLFGPCLEVLGWYVRLLTTADMILSEQAEGLSSTDMATGEAAELTPEFDQSPLSVGFNAADELRSFACIENLRQKLVALEEAQERQDAAGMADLLEFELSPIIRLWTSEVPQLLHRLDHASAEA